MSLGHRKGVYRTVPCEPELAVTHYEGTVVARVAQLRIWMKSVFRISLPLAMSHGPGRVFRAWHRAKRKLGQAIHVEDLPMGPRLRAEQRRAEGPEIPPRPPAKAHPFKARFMRHGRFPEPRRTLTYRDPPLSGLTLAGVGEETPKRLAKFYHAGHNHIYGAMNLAFNLLMHPKAVAALVRVQWDNRRATGPIARDRLNVGDPVAMADTIKQLAKACGATHVGCTAVVEEAVYAPYDDVLPHAVVVAAPMDRETLLGLPDLGANLSFLEGYYDVGHAALDVAEYIRSLGWRAEADTNLGNAPEKVLHVPLAVNAGLGTMGRHTSLITESHGANVRLAVVLTDLPLAFDEPVDFGVESMCANCRVCRENCPSNAIYEDKQMVRGVKKWHLDFDRCMPYFNENDGCGVCITVCPWSQSGYGPLTALMQRQRARVAESWPDPLPVEDRLLALSPRPDTAPHVPAVGRPEDWWQEVEITGLRNLPGGIVELSLELPDRGPLPDWSAGAHIELRLPSARVRPYSLSNLPEEGRYRVAVKVAQDGRGGSREVGTLRLGARLSVSRPGNNLLVPEDLPHTILCAGGIGITVIAALARRLTQLGASWEVHYSVKSEDQAIYADEILALDGGPLTIHTDVAWLEIPPMGRPEGTGIVTCGPRSYMHAVRDWAVEGGIDPRRYYSEAFGSDRKDAPFDVFLGSSGEPIRIEPGQTIARELSRRGIHVPVSCGYGICGACTAGLLEGEQDARDCIFSDEERRTKITLCCSRAKGKRIVIDL